MAQRFEILDMVFRSVSGAPLLHQGASCTVKDLQGNSLTVYQAETGSPTFTNPLTSDSSGQIEGWVDAPDFDIAVSGAGISSYTQKVRQSPPGVFNVKSYGAKGDGTTNDRAAIQAAIDACVTAGGGTVDFPAGTYLVSTTLNWSGNWVTLRGAGAAATTVQSSASDVLTVTADINECVLSNIRLLSASGGGHVVTVASGNDVIRCRLEKVRLVQANNAKSVWHQNDTGHFIGNLVTDSYLEHTTSASVPGWYFLSTHATLRNCNSNTWERTWAVNSGTWFFHLEQTSATGGSTFNYDNVWRDMTGEILNGGAVKLLSSQGALVERFDNYDLGTTTQHLFFIGKGGSGTASKFNTIRQCGRRGGTLGATKKDIFVDGANASFTTIEKYETSSGFPVIDLQGSTYTSLIDLPDGTTVENVGQFSRRVGADQYGTLASATTLTVPGAATVVSVTGSTTVTSITAVEPGRRLTIIWAAAATFDVTDGSNLKLAGSVTTLDADDTLSLICDGTNWHETGRSVN